MIAVPNKLYVHYINFKNVTIEARKTGTQTRFYEIRDGKQVKCLTKDTVKSLFPVGLRKYQPFLKTENKQFYLLLK